jgi:hypothetical protein
MAHYEIVIPRRKRTVDVKAPSWAQLIDDLADRMIAALAEVLKTATKDEKTGHAFHGNQWTGGISGPKPTEAIGPNAKTKLRNLLESGHPFTKKELMEIAGITNESTFTSWIGMLKNPKYAGPKGALQVVKLADGSYQVQGLGNVVAEATAAVAQAKLPPHLEKLVPKMEKSASVKMQGAKAVVTEVHVPGYSPEPIPELTKELQAKADPVAAIAGSLGTPGAISTAEASAVYDKTIAGAQEDLVEMILAGKGDWKAQMLQFKQTKAAAMAKWAHSVHGTAYNPAPQALFKADSQLALDILAGGDKAAKAFPQWKLNTNAEKQGKFPAAPAPKALPKAKMAEPTSTAVTLMSQATPVKAKDYDSLVPKGFKEITAAEATSPKGFQAGIANLKTALTKEGEANAVANKKSVENRLRDRLKDKPNFQALVKRLGLVKEGHGSLEARLVSTWAGSSGDNNPLSVAVQLAARDAFSIPDHHIEKKALTALEKASHNEDDVYKNAMPHLNPNIKGLQHDELPVFKAALQEFVHAQYEETQALFKAQGRKEIYLARGMRVNHNVDINGPSAQLKLQPASSFSANYATAKAFAGPGGTVFITKVPVEQVMSTYVTGFGCTSEHEVVVLAHDKMRAFTVAKNYASSAKEATEHLAGMLKKKGA